MSARNGLGQEERLPRALTPHYVDVDELSMPQLLSSALGYAGLVRFAEQGGAADGPSWRGYYGVNDALIIAEILAARLERGVFDDLLAHGLGGHARSGAALRREQLPSFILYRMLAHMERWSALLLKHGTPAGIDLGALIADLRARMDPRMDGLSAFYAARTPWDEGADLPALLGELAQRLEVDTAPPASQQAHLRTLFHQLAKALDLIQRGAVQRLQRVLASGTHDPGVGMLLAFVQLYGAAQRKANRLTERHLDFYYEQVLRMQPRAACADSTYLVFPPVAAGTRVTVPAATAFLAPLVRGRPELSFDSRHELVVSDAVLVAAYTLHLERDPETMPENALLERRHQQLLGYPTACRLEPLSLPPAAAAPHTAALTAHPLFGARRAGSMAPRRSAARLGFALASNVLLLEDGERALHVTLLLGEDRHGGEGDAGATLGARLARLPELLRTSMGDALNRVLRRLFTLSLSGAAGWLALPEYSAEFVAGAPGQHGAPDALHLYFTLGPEYPPVTGYRAAIHGEGYAVTAPVLKVELNADGYLYPYGLLRGLPLVQARIEADVKRHRALVLHNQIGPLSAHAPFMPFGPLPALGSYLIVGSAETAAKRLTHAELVLEWAGLPPSGSLADYYDSYGIAPGYGGVRATVGVLADGRWQELPGGAAPAWLFKPDRDQAAPGAQTRFVLTPALHLARPSAQPPLAPADFSYGPAAKNGFFKLSLAGAPFVFGHRDYPYVLAETLSYNSQPRLRRRVRGLPNPPYTPVLEMVSLNYRAVANLTPTVEADGDALVRLYPLGWDMARAGADDGDLLLPQIDYDGNLVLGLRATDLHAPLTLFFHLLEDALPMASGGSTRVQWSYLSSNGWKALPPHAVRADSTRGFLRSGIVTLTIPHDIDRGHTVMPPGLFWLRLSGSADLERYCHLYAVHPHAAQVWRRLDDAGADAPAQLPAASIRRPRQAIPGLGAPLQMVDSFGGRLREDRQQMRVRTAERLAHKNRAITAEDYERLVLERFPQVDRVKCFPNLSLRLRPDGGVCPGHVLVVALPPFVAQGRVGVLPRLNGDLIAQLGDYLATRAGPAVQLEVANPFYQRIQVRCRVRLAPGVDEGWYVNRLDRLVSDYISPWQPGGNCSHFGWTIRQHDVESALLAEEGVLSVTEFSMLSISDQGRERFVLTDSAAPNSKGEAAPDIVPDTPWSIAVPNQRHAILIDGSEQSIAAVRTGLGKLEIGDTFILSSGLDHAEEK